MADAEDDSRGNSRRFSSMHIWLTVAWVASTALLLTSTVTLFVQLSKESKSCQVARTYETQLSASFASNPYLQYTLMVSKPPHSLHEQISLKYDAGKEQQRNGDVGGFPNIMYIGEKDSTPFFVMSMTQSNAPTMSFQTMPGAFNELTSKQVVRSFAIQTEVKNYVQAGMIVPNYAQCMRNGNEKYMAKQVKAMQESAVRRSMCVSTLQQPTVDVSTAHRSSTSLFSNIHVGVLSWVASLSIFVGVSWLGMRYSFTEDQEIPEPVRMLMLLVHYHWIGVVAAIVVMHIIGRSDIPANNFFMVYLAVGYIFYMCRSRDEEVEQSEKCMPAVDEDETAVATTQVQEGHPTPHTPHSRTNPSGYYESPSTHNVQVDSVHSTRHGGTYTRPVEPIQQEHKRFNSVTNNVTNRKGLGMMMMESDVSPYQYPTDTYTGVRGHWGSVHEHLKSRSASVRDQCLGDHAYSLHSYFRPVVYTTLYAILLASLSGFNSTIFVQLFVLTCFTGSFLMYYGMEVISLTNPEEEARYPGKIIGNLIVVIAIILKLSMFGIFLVQVFIPFQQGNMHMDGLCAAIMYMVLGWDLVYTIVSGTVSMWPFTKQLSVNVDYVMSMLIVFLLIIANITATWPFDTCNLWVEPTHTMNVGNNLHPAMTPIP